MTTLLVATTQTILQVLEEKKGGWRIGESQDLFPPRALSTNPKLPRNKN